MYQEAAKNKKACKPYYFFEVAYPFKNMVLFPLVWDLTGCLPTVGVGLKGLNFLDQSGLAVYFRPGNGLKYTNANE